MEIIQCIGGFDLVITCSFKQILYDDGDVEVLRLEKERWEIIDKEQKLVKFVVILMTLF